MTISSIYAKNVTQLVKLAIIPQIISIVSYAHKMMTHSSTFKSSVQ